MKKVIFDLIISPFSLFKDPLGNYLAMALIGAVSYVIAYRSVGELGLKGESASIMHWIIRIIVFVLIWLACCVAIKIVLFVGKNWLLILICSIALISIFVTKKYADKHHKSILNKRVF